MCLLFIPFHRFFCVVFSIVIIIIIIVIIIIVIVIIRLYRTSLLLLCIIMRFQIFVRFSQGNHTDFRIDVEGLDRPSWALYLCGYSSRGRKGHFFGPVRLGNSLNTTPTCPLNSNVNTQLISALCFSGLFVCALNFLL